MEIDPKNYITDSEIKEIVRQEIIDYVRGDRERMFYNAVSNSLSTMLQNEINNDMKQELEQRAKAAIKEKDLQFEMFRKPDAWDRSEGYAYKILQNACNKNANLLEEKVIEKFNNLTDEYIADNVADIVRKMLLKN